ncbi:MAG TPA: sigma-70 family RNA polymerase sigma factor, partial [Solirubrobacteraceae bacterium]
PRRDEVAAALGVEVADLARKEQEIATSDVTSLNSLVAGEEESSVERIDTLVSHERASDPERATMADAAKGRFREAFERLPRREREVAVLLYVKHLTLREIGDILGVSESRVCQIHGQLKRSLRDVLAGDAPLFSEVA